MRSNNRERIDFWIEDLDNHLHSVGQSLRIHLRDQVP